MRRPHLEMLKGRPTVQKLYGLNKGIFTLYSLFRCSGLFGSQRKSLEDKIWDGYSENEEEDDFSYSDIPRPRKKWERKPYVTPMKILIQRAKQERQARKENPCHVLKHAPDNGLLVPDLIEVARQVYNARELMLTGLSQLHNGDDGIPIKKCRFCNEVHIGHQGHEIRTCEGPGSASRNAMHVWRRGQIRDVVGFPYCYHLYDRVGKPRVGHKERFGVQRLPAIVELCIQAGVDLMEYPTKRRTKPVYSIEGSIADFEPDQEDSVADGAPVPLISISDNPYKDMNQSEISYRTLQHWFEMTSGASKIMKKYSVITCGYCPEVQVGHKGHKVRMCKAAKHQFRDGLHAWQEATIDDLIWPNYVWHVRDLRSPLSNELKRYYGKAPAIVELCVQAGAPAPKQYREMMRLDVVSPALDEYDLVA